MLLLNELEEAVCHRFCCLLAQGDIVSISQVVIIVSFQLLSRFSVVLCSSAHGSGLIVCLLIVRLVVFGMLCSVTCASEYVAWLCGIITNADLNLSDG